MKKLLLIGSIVFAVAVLAILAEIVRRTYFEPKGSPSHLRRIATQINGRAPIDAGEMMEVTGAESTATTLTVHYKVLNALAANIDAPIQRKMHEILRSHACEDGGLRDVLEGGATLHYAMVDMNGVPILDTDIQRWECGAAPTAPSSR